MNKTTNRIQIKFLIIIANQTHRKAKYQMSNSAMRVRKPSSETKPLKRDTETKWFDADLSFISHKPAGQFVLLHQTRSSSRIARLESTSIQIHFLEFAQIFRKGERKSRLKSHDRVQQEHNRNQMTPRLLTCLFVMSKNEPKIIQ